MHHLVETHREAIKRLAARRGLRNVRVIGAMVQDDAQASSSLDLLVCLEPGRSGLVLGGFLMDVQELTGRRVEVVTEAGLHPALKERVLREAQRL